MKHRKVFNPEELVTLRRLAEINLPMKLIAQHFKISKDTLERMTKTNAAVCAAMDWGRAMAALKIRASLLESCFTSGPEQAESLKMWIRMKESNKPTSHQSYYLYVNTENPYEEYDPQFFQEFNDILSRVRPLIGQVFPTKLEEVSISAFPDLEPILSLKNVTVKVG